MEPVNDVWIMSHASHIRAGNVPSQHASYSLSKPSFHLLLCRVWRTKRSLGCQVSGNSLKNCRSWEEQRTQKHKPCGPGQEENQLEKTNWFWCRIDEWEGAEVWGRLDPSQDPQPPLKVIEASEGSQEQGNRWRQQSERRNRGMSEAKGPRGDGTKSSKAEEYSGPAESCVAATRTGWNTGWCLKTMWKDSGESRI